MRRNALPWFLVAASVALAAAVPLFSTSGSRSGLLAAALLTGLLGLLSSRRVRAAEPEPAARKLRQRPPRGREARLLLQARLDEAVEQLEQQRNTVTELIHASEVQTDRCTSIERRLALVEASQKTELAALNSERARRQQDLTRLQATIETHKSEVAALEHTLDLAMGVPAKRDEA